MFCQRYNLFALNHDYKLPFKCHFSNHTCINDNASKSRTLIINIYILKCYLGMTERLKQKVLVLHKKAVLREKKVLSIHKMLLVHVNLLKASIDKAK